MTREELIDYLKGLYKNTDFCTVCQKYGLYCAEHCAMKDALDYLQRPLGERLVEVLREVRGEEMKILPKPKEWPPKRETSRCRNRQNKTTKKTT